MIHEITKQEGKTLSEYYFNINNNNYSLLSEVYTLSYITYLS